MSKFILTGATGFIGSNVAKLLIEKGHDVFIICRVNSNIEVLNNILDKENIFRFDNNINTLIDYFKKIKCDCVINIASLFLANHTSTDIENLIDSNLKFTTYILETMKICGTKNIINTGTSWQHYNNEEYNPVCLYAATKEAFEKILDYYVKAIGFRCITLKLFDTYGDGDKRKKLLNTIKEKSISGEKLSLSKGEQQLDLTHVNDIANGYLKAFEYLNFIKYGEHKKYALCTGRRLNLKEIVSIFEKETNLKVNVAWGVLDYRNREVMRPWSNYEVLPNWKSNISFEEGVKSLLKDEEKISRQKVLDAVEEYYNKVYKIQNAWHEGDRIPYAGRCFDKEELLNLSNATLDFWLTSGRYCDEFENKLSKYLGVKYCLLTNSGSSANLLAFSALTSPKLKERQIKKGDEVITVAACFPTTIAPILQHGAVPVFVDINLLTANINVDEIEGAISSKTKAIFIAHTLGNPFDLAKVKEICKKYNLWLIEDNCDALGAKYFIDGQWRYTGTVGDIGTSSFYPPHHITTGEGGAVYTNNSLLSKIILSFRDWGRDCYCKSGCDNTCKNRFNMKFGNLPFGYDHKYVYSHLGYNLKATDMQGAIGCAQIEKLPQFIAKRKHNFKVLKDALKDIEDYVMLPEATKNSEPSPFGFLMILKKTGQNRRDLLQYLQDNGIQTRLLFAGNIINQPLFDEIRGDNTKYRVIGQLKNTDIITNSSFFVGVYPGIDDNMINYMAKLLREYFIKE